MQIFILLKYSSQEQSYGGLGGESPGCLNFGNTLNLYIGLGYIILCRGQKFLFVAISHQISCFVNPK